jgi:hypothetical protein
MKKLASAGLCALAVVGLFIACDSGGVPVTCYDIPDGGCPVQGGVECEDPTCAAAYNCEPDGGWSLAYACPAHDGGVDDVGSEATVSDAGYDIDAPPGAFGGPGCEDLEPPDCPLGLVLVCNSCCGCEDLYVCDDGGWDPWGECTDAGPVSSP